MNIEVTPQVIQKLSIRNKLAFSISILAFFFFFPGIYLSMLTIATTGSINAKIPHVAHTILGFPLTSGSVNEHMDLHIFDTTRSILTTIYSLWLRDYIFVSCMILLFSVMIPITKGLLLIYSFFKKSSTQRKKIFTFIKSIGKWSMSDVFIVSIFLAYLSTGATQTENVKNIMMMGHSVHVDVLAGMHAHLEAGFWCFLIYCLLSLLALQLYEPY